MKFTAATVAALVGSTYAAHEGAFAVLRFNGKEVTRGRADPIVSPGETSQHVHGAVGASGFSKDATGESLARSKCTSAKVKEDLSSYWFPWVYFQDPETEEFEPVDINYVNVYYFMDKTNDDIKAFPRGLSMVAGNASTRIAPSGGGALNLDPSNGPIQAAQWTCPRANDNFDNPPSWPSNSDGSTAGIRDPVNKGAGTGFPDVDCDGLYSPLRADIHMPSCYNPEESLTSYKTNTAYPSSAGGGRVDCPEGWIHVPHMFFEIYWSTSDFSDRWTPGRGQQPFVMSSGDVTGFSNHADFMAAWDEDVLQNVIDNCNAGHAGLHSCPGVTPNDDECQGENIFEEIVTGLLDILPGDRPLEGWSHPILGGDSSDNTPAPKPDTPEEGEQEEEEEEPEETPVIDIPPINHAPEEDGDNLPTPSFEEASSVAPTPIFSSIVEEPEAPETPAPEPEPQPEPVPEPEPETSTCEKKIKTVWETVIVTATATEVLDAAPTPEQHKRHLHNHAFRHRSLRR